MKRRVITEQDVKKLAKEGFLKISRLDLITPLAQDLIREKKIKLIYGDNPGREGEKIALGSDHAGFELKEELKKFLDELGYEYIDCGTDRPDPVDYPDIARAVANLIVKGNCSKGIVIDGAGIGSCIVANKFSGIRAALCYDLSTAQNAREHNDANVLTLGARLIGKGLAKDIVRKFLETSFAGGRHLKRVEKIREIESRER